MTVPHAGPEQEARWLAQVAAGDRGDPLVALYRCWAGRFHRLGLRSLGDPGQAEELVQEAFVRLWQSASRFDPARGTASAFAFTIAHRVAVDLHRRSAARPRLAASAGEDALAAAPDSGAEDELDRIATDFLVREALDALSPKHREVLLLTFDEDLTDAGIADRLGIPVGTVRSRTYYALRAMRLELEERGIVG